MPKIALELSDKSVRIYWKNYLSVLTVYTIKDGKCTEWQHRFAWHAWICWARKKRITNILAAMTQAEAE